MADPWDEGVVESAHASELASRDRSRGGYELRTLVVEMVDSNPEQMVWYEHMSLKKRLGLSDASAVGLDRVTRRGVQQLTE